MIDFTIKNLEIFVEVAERSSFSLAAESLYLSQSSVSSAISALEKNFGVQLLERTARKKVELTNDGEVLYPLAKYSLQGTTQGRYLTGGVPPVRFSM